MPFTLFCGMPFMPKLLLRLMLPLAMLTLATGCGARPEAPRVPFSAEGGYLEGPAGAGVVADPDSPIADVPRPIGFRLLRSRSSTDVSGETRRVRHVYQGRAAVLDVVTMYRRHLPRADWNYLGREQQGSTTVLRYTKGPEQLTLRIGEEGVLSTLTAIVVEIGPST